MRVEFPLQKTITLGALAVLIAADGVLAFYGMKSPTRSSQNELAAQRTQIKFLKADIIRAQAIQDGMPGTKADCQRFEDSLLSSSVGYSAVTAELTEVAKHSGLQIASLGFKPKELPGRDLVQIELDATVNGDYKGVVRFLNGLQRSKNYYIVDSLALASGLTGQAAPGALRVELHLRSYFRNAG